MSKPNEARPSHVIAHDALQSALSTLTAVAPKDGSEADIHYAETILALRVAFAYFNTYVFIPAQGDTKTE